MNEQIDIYCERLDPSFWAEPLNALTNLAFIIAAFCAFRLAKNEDYQFKVLALIIGLVGIGSFLFHTFATKWAMLADVIPIAAFIYYSVWVFFRKICHLKHLYAWLGLILFFIASGVLRHFVPQDALNGSVEYLPAIFGLIAFAIYSKEKIFLYAVGVFLVSFTMRSIDMELCEETHGIGTHIFWHILNGVTLYLVTLGLIRASKKQSNQVSG